jgi:hypothetical protein
MKKTSAKSKGKRGKTRPAKKKSSPKSKKPVDLVEVRKDITEIVGNEAVELTRAVVLEGRKGQLAPVKYLFEKTGVYPAAGESHEKPEEASLAKTLLHRLGLPEDLVVKRDDDEPLKLSLPEGKTGHEREKENSGIPDAQPERQNNQAGEDADKDDAVPVLAESIP